MLSKFGFEAVQMTCMWPILHSLAQLYAFDAKHANFGPMYWTIMVCICSYPNPDCPRHGPINNKNLEEGGGGN